MRILIAHNHYGQFAAGGEANVMNAESELLEKHGHTVLKYERTNAEIRQMAMIAKINHFFRIGCSPASYRAMRKLIDDFKPHILHVHNYWFMLTPAVFAAAKDAGVPTLLTLHNYRLLCPGNQFLRRGRVCESCLDGRGVRSLWHRCYPDRSFFKTFLSWRLFSLSRRKNFLPARIDGYIALSAFAKIKFSEAGWPEEKIFVKPNFMDDPLEGKEPEPPGREAVYAGRISPEKGLLTLMRAWQGVDFPLAVIGAGPQLAEVRRAAPANVTFVGAKSRAETMDRIGRAAFFIFPSLWYEGFPLSLLEAMALGRCVVASDLGPRREMVEDGVSGLLFAAGDVDDLKRKILSLIGRPERQAEMGAAGRRAYLQCYTPDRNYRMLVDIYQKLTA